jgi:hypothetical protein
MKPNSAKKTDVIAMFAALKRRMEKIRTDRFDDAKLNSF